MKYKELLERYQEGLLEEKVCVEIEEALDKHEAIEEFLMDRMDDVLDEKVALASESLEKSGEEEGRPKGSGSLNQETKRIKQSVNRRLGLVILSSVLIVVALYFGFNYGVSALVDSMYYDPTAETIAEETAYKNSDFYYGMQAYVSLNMPGFTSGSFTYEDSEGFGRYEVSYVLDNQFADYQQRYFHRIDKGRLTYAIDGIFGSDQRFGFWESFNMVQNYFPEEDEKETMEFREHLNTRNNDMTWEYLEELNNRAYVSMSLVFEEDLTMTELTELMQANQNLKFQWVGVRTREAGTSWSENQPMHLIGFNPNVNDEPSSGTKPDPEEYPLFYLVDGYEYEGFESDDYMEQRAEGYELHVTSRIKCLLNQEAFVSLFDYNKYKTDFYEEALEYINEQGAMTYGVMVYGTVEDLVECLEDISYTSIYINEVLPTKPNIYY